MRTAREPSPVPTDLGRKVTPPAPPTREPAWVPIPGQPGYERQGTDGPVRRMF